jgi:sec-independent protein translocase protein TatC
MSLGEHYHELKRRLVISALAVALGGVAGWFVFNPLLSILRQPVNDYKAAHPDRGAEIQQTLTGLASGFSLHLSLAIFTGVVIACPIWLYQVWAFVLPGLTAKEKRISRAFFAAGVPLFVGGIVLAHYSLQIVIPVLLDFTPKGAANFQTLPDYISFVTRFSLGFGFAFLVPVVQVALNMLGILPSSAMLKSWRVAVFLIFVFAAMMMPSPDPYSMMLLALPLVVLFFGAIGVSRLLERGKRKSRADWLETADDEASPL